MLGFALFAGLLAGGGDAYASAANGVRLLAALCAWAAALLLWPALAPGQSRQCGALFVAGVVAFAVAALRTGGLPDGASRLLDANLAIVAMLSATGFIRLASAALPVPRGKPPHGSRALLQTLAGTAALGGAINITALVIVADRLAVDGKLPIRDASWLVRAFTLAALYSPFIAGMAFALSFAPGVSLLAVFGTGAALAAFGVLSIWLRARSTEGRGLDSFNGYPLRVDALWLPVGLTVAVFAAKHFFPGVAVLTLVTLLAPLASALVLIARTGAGRGVAQMARHVDTELPSMSGELWLFLAAGMLATGLGQAFAAFDLSLPLTHFGPVAAAGVLAVVLVVAALGLHPVISLSALVPLLLPLNPAPEVLVVLCASGWSIGCGVCPYAGTNLVVQGRFGHDSWQLVRRGYGQAGLMWAACSLALAALYYLAG